MTPERIAAIRQRRDNAFPDALDLTAMWRTVPDLLDALAGALERERSAREALEWIRDGLDRMYSETNPHGLRHLPEAPIVAERPGRGRGFQAAGSSSTANA